MGYRITEDDISEINKNFEISIKCKKCKSKQVEIEFTDEYSGDDTYIGQSVYIKCQKCGAFFIS